MLTPVKESYSGYIRNTMGKDYKKKVHFGRVEVAHTFNPSTWEAEAVGFLGVRGQPHLQN